MEYFEIENRKTSNKFYDLAIDAANERNLFLATEHLKKALLFNKKNTNARNLLALIFFETGAVVEAIVQFFISKQMSPNESVASSYLQDIQNDKNLQNYFESAHIYNDALSEIDFGREDLAMMKLYKAVELNPHNIKAMSLLAVLLIRINDHIKAGSFLLRCQKIDNGNVFINKYMDYVLKNTKKSEIREKKLKNVYSFKKLESDDVILPRKYIRLTENQKVVFIIMGILIGSISYAMLIAPKATTAGTSSELVRYADLVNDQNKTIRDITIENEQLKTDYENASVKLRAYEEQNRLFTSQYETLNSIISDFDNGYISRAAKNYVELDKDMITDESLVELLNQARSRIEGIGAKRLCELGTESWNGGNKNAAISYYQLSLSINPDDPETMFLLARLYQSTGKTTDANTIFDKIIAQHPESNYAKRAREARGY